MPCCEAGLRSMRLEGPVTVMSRASTPPDEGRGAGTSGGRPLTDAATSRAETGSCALFTRESCRGDNSGFARPAPVLSLPGDFGNSGNAIGLELALHSGVAGAHYVPFDRRQQAAPTPAAGETQARGIFSAAN